MGLCAGAPDNHPASPPEVIQKSREIDSQLRASGKVQSKTKKMLLLGAGDSGKTTFLKQCNLLYGDGNFGDAKENHRKVVGNLVSGMQSLLIGGEILGIPIESDNKESALRIIHCQTDLKEEQYDSIFADLRKLWGDTGVQAVYKRENEVQVPSNVSYFFSELDRLSMPPYAQIVPSDNDILHLRIKTAGIQEFSFIYEGSPFTVVDVGGQRSERKKWLHAFDSVDALLFFASLAEFDQKLEEDNRVNRMAESLRLFQEIIASRWFCNSSIVLLLNKWDIFQQKIALRDLRCIFPDYTGGNDPQVALEFIRRRYLAANINKQREIYPHVTCATDTTIIKNVFKAIASRLLDDALRAAI